MPPKGNNKKKEDRKISSFEANYKHQSEAQYPYLLAVSIINSEDQFEEARAMKMLGDWVEEYAKLSEIFKYKYSSYIPKILKLLTQAYQQKRPIEYCLARFLINFFPTWDELTHLISSNIKQSDRYSMELIWYTCHNLVEDLNLEKQPLIISYLTKNYEKPFLYYKPKTSVEARKILEIVFLLNIHGCQPQFQKHVQYWAENFEWLKSASNGQSKTNTMIQIIRNKNLLHSTEKSKQYWFSEVQLFLNELQQKIQTMEASNVMDKSLLNLFIWLFEFKEIKQLLIKQEKRYMRTLLHRSRLKDNPEYIFTLPKYREIRDNLYTLYFEKDKEATRKKIGNLLEQFIGHSYSIFNDEYNYTFLDCLSEKQIKLNSEVVTDIIKLLGNSHVRRSISAKVIMVLGKTITAALDSCQLAPEVVGQCLKAFNQSSLNKVNDPNIGQLRRITTHLYLNIMQRYQWQDGFKNEVILTLCEQFQRNSKQSNDNVMQILEMLVVKFGFTNQTKMEPIINDIFYKSLTDEQHLHSLISLLVTIGNYLNYPRAGALVQELCAKNPSPHANFFLFQAMMITRKGPPSQADYQTIKDLFTEPQSSWDRSRIDINLMMIQLFFLRLQPNQAISFFQKIDNAIFQKLVSWYEENNYRLLTMVAGKMLGALGGDPELLQTLKTYRWIREYSFQMLARSFYKTTSITVCYIFSNIILKSDKPSITIRWLSKQQFLDYLYQGLNDFLSKQKRFTKQIVTSILVYKLLKYEPSLIPPGSRLFDFSTLLKNVSWWEQVKQEITYVPFQEKTQYSNWILPEFRTHYQKTINIFFKNYFEYYEEKKRKAEEIQIGNHEEDI